MIDAMKEIKEYDAIFFIPHEENDDQVKIKSALYTDPGEKYGGTAVGDFYDIILFRLDDEYNMTDLDKFEAILAEPRYYVSRMVREDWYGLVAKKTTTSDKFVNDVFDKWQED